MERKRYTNFLLGLGIAAGLVSTAFCGYGVNVLMNGEKPRSTSTPEPTTWIGDGRGGGGVDLFPEGQTPQPTQTTIKSKESGCWDTNNLIWLESGTPAPFTNRPENGVTVVCRDGNWIVHEGTIFQATISGGDRATPLPTSPTP